MENPFLAFFIFVLILFFYIHITTQWKTSNDLEIYESDYESASQLQEVCAVKQPVVFKFQKNQVADAFFERFQTAKFEKYDNLDIRIKDRNDYDKQPLNNQQSKEDFAVDYVPLSFRSARRLMSSDTTAKYFSEKNQPFLEESGLDRLCNEFDAYLRPPLSAYTKYDLLIGSPLVTTPLRYHLESHHFIAVSRGKIRVKLGPPKYSKIIPTNRDYENYEFWSPLNLWSATAITKVDVTAKTNQEYKDILHKTKFLDIEVNVGDVLFVPPYWWYSVSFSGDSETTVATFTYDVAMNIAAQSKHWGVYYLQQSNIKNKPGKKIQGLDSVSEATKSEATKRLANESIKVEEVGVDYGVVSKETANTIDTTIPHSVAVKRQIVTNAGIYVTGEM
jgi:hypothetical protein